MQKVGQEKRREARKVSMFEGGLSVHERLGGHQVSSTCVVAHFSFSHSSFQQVKSRGFAFSSKSF